MKLRYRIGYVLLGAGFLTIARMALDAMKPYAIQATTLPLRVLGIYLILIVGGLTAALICWAIGLVSGHGEA